MDDEWNWFDTLPGAVQEEWNAMNEVVWEVAALWVMYDPDGNVSLYAHDKEIDVEALREKARQILNKR